MIIRTYMFEKFQVDNDLFSEFKKKLNLKKITSSKKRELSNLEEKSENTITKIKIMTDTSLFIYFLLYFSVISTFFIDSFFFDLIELVATKIIGVVGTSALFLLAYFLSKLKDIQYQKLGVLTTKRIHIYMDLIKLK